MGKPLINGGSSKFLKSLVDICVDRNFWVICGIFRKLNPESMIFFRNQFTCSLAISVQRQVVYTCIIYSSSNVPIRPSHLAN